MTWRLEGLERRMRKKPGSASSRCGMCGWGVSYKSPAWAGRMARAHTRETGHVTRTAHVVVTEYRKAA